VIIVRHLDTNGLDVLVRKLYSPQTGSNRNCAVHNKPNFPARTLAFLRFRPPRDGPIRQHDAA
jgi:hypothetical protein